jgi:hypothetical protein
MQSGNSSEALHQYRHHDRRAIDRHERRNLGRQRLDPSSAIANWRPIGDAVISALLRNVTAVSS